MPMLDVFHGSAVLDERFHLGSNARREMSRSMRPTTVS